VNHIHRIAAIAVTSGVAVASLAAPSAATTHHAAPRTKLPAAAAAGYLARALAGKHHDHYTSVYGKQLYPNYGETADGVLSMDAAGVAQTAAARATAWLEKEVTHYAVGSPTDYPGASAKLLLVAEAQHVDPASFGGVDLVGAIQATEGAGGAAAGEYQQNPGFPSPTSYLVSQALPVLALAATGQPADQPDAAAVTFLADQQCTDGGFQTKIRTNLAKPCGKEDPDDTGYAVQALIAALSHHAAKKGLAYLVKTEHKNGGFGSPANANSTALALQALVAGHRAFAKPMAWLVDRQVGCSGSRAHRGAVALQKKYDASALLATSQAGAALAGSSLAGIDNAGAHAAAPVLSCHKKK
jgi:hypothetical protein